MAKTTAGKRVPNSKFIVEGEKGQVDHSDVMAVLALSVTEKPKSLLKYVTSTLAPNPTTFSLLHLTLAE